MKQNSLRIAVADDEPVMRQYLEEILPELDHQVVATAQDGRELVEACRTHIPDLVITDIHMPVMDGLEAVRIVNRDSLMPVLFISGYNEWMRVAEVEREVVSVFVLKPVTQSDVKLAIDLVMQRFHQFQELLREEPNIQNALLDRQEIERAKAFLIRWRDLTDRRAFDYIRHRAHQRNQPLIHAAQDILAGYEL